MSSFVETRVLTLSDRLAELEKDRRNNITSHQSDNLVQPSEDLSKQATDNLLSFVQQTSERTKREIDRLINELMGLQKRLDDGRSRVQQQIANYTALNQSAAHLTQIALDGTIQVGNQASTEPQS
jgi:hypothetical protein